MSKKGKSKNQKRLHDIRTYGGRGKIRCGVCGEPITKHDTMDFCENGKNGEMDPSFLIDEVGRRRMRREKK